MRSTFLLITSCFILLPNSYYSGAPSSRFDIALEYDVNAEDDTDDDHDSDDTEKMTNKHVDEND